MMTVIAILIFAAAFGAAATTIYATVRPSLPKIYAALSGTGGQTMLPPLPPRRAPAMRVNVRPVTGQMTEWRAAA
jgi:hypothetical protein